MPRLVALTVLVAVLLTGTASGSPARVELRDPVWSRDGTMLAFVRAQGSVGRIFVTSSTGASTHILTPSQPLPYGITWSPDGHALAYASGGDIWNVDLAPSRIVQLTTAPELEAMQPAWSPDGSTIAYTVFEGCFRCTRIYGVDPASGNRRPLEDGARRPAWSRDGSLLLTSSPVNLVDIASGRSRSIDGSGSYASWSLDGTEFVYMGARGLYVSTPTRTAPLLLLPSAHVLAYPTISPSHLRVAFVRGRRVVLYRRYLKTQKVLPRSDSANDAPAWSFRGQLAFVAAGACGRRSEIDVTRSDGSRQRAIVRACS